MNTTLHYAKAALLGAMLLSMTASPALAQKKNPERDVFFGQTHSHTSWSVDAYLIGKQLTREDEKRLMQAVPHA